MGVTAFTAEQMCRIECLIQHLGGEEKCDPEGDWADLSVSQFIMIVMLDVLKYLGLVGSDNPSQEYKRVSYKQKMFRETLEQFE